ncbi:MAG: DUF4286 family protein [Nitrososphaerales archaeon]|nr:DUF4286 family protein [Nitrososphaerales archaeon]
MPKVLYTVWFEIDPAVEAEWEKWMRSVHVPQVVRAGSFKGAKMYSVKEGRSAKHAMIYEAKDSAALKSYLDGPAKALREDYMKHFGEKSKLTRMVLEETFSF